MDLLLNLVYMKNVEVNFVDVETHRVECYDYVKETI